MAVIDFHAHVTIPEVVAFSRGRGVDPAPPDDPRIPASDREAFLRWRATNLRKMTAPRERLRDMDRMGVDVQVLTTSILTHCTYWADPEESLAMERLANERIAEVVAAAPQRFVGLGGVPLQSPALAVQELERCMGSLGLKGVQISTRAGDMELGDERLRPFWEAAQRLGAVVYIHPAGITDTRFRKFHLWNSIGQPLEESMAMASLMHEGILDEFRRLKLCVAHGGGYLPYYTGRADRNHREKAFIRAGMKRSPSRYLETAFRYDSCVYDPAILQVLVRKVGAERVMLGSDYPVGDKDPVGFVRNAPGLSAADRKRILGLNAEAFLGL